MPIFNDRIEALLRRLDAAGSDEEMRAAGEELLREDPCSPYGKLAVWESLGADEGLDNLDLLTEALDEIRAVVESRDEPAFIEGDRYSQTYCSILMNLGHSLLSEGQVETALEIAKEMANFDDEGYFPSRELLYRCMLDLDMYDEILAVLEIDPLESVVGEHARAIAMIETGADPDDIRDAVNYAVELSPDVPFFVLGIWDFPEEEDEDAGVPEEIILDATYLAEPWNKTEQLLAQLCIPVFLLGYLTERMEDEKEIETLLRTYEAAGVIEDVARSRSKIAEMIRADRDPEEIDAAAMGEVEELVGKMFSGRDEVPFI